MKAFRDPRAFPGKTMGITREYLTDPGQGKQVCFNELRPSGVLRVPEASSNGSVLHPSPSQNRPPLECAKEVWQSYSKNKVINLTCTDSEGDL